MNPRRPPSAVHSRSHRRLWLLGLLMLAVACAWLRPLDDIATEQAETGLKRAMASFATARALNAVISVVQGTEFALQPLGVGVSLAPGQVLAPVNDLVEKFSTLMLYATVAYGVQMLLVNIGSYWAMSLLLSVVALTWAWSVARGRFPPSLLSRLLVALLLVRFVVPVAGIVSDASFALFMEQEYLERQRGIESATEVFGAASSAVGEGRKWWEITEHMTALKSAADRSVEHMVRLIVVFLFQTLLLPLLVIWVLLRAGRSLFAEPRLLGAHGSG